MLASGISAIFHPAFPTYQGFESYYGIPYSNDMWRDPANTVAKDVVLREGLTIKEVTSGHREKNKVPLMRDEEIIEYPVDQNTITKKYTEEANLHSLKHAKTNHFSFICLTPWFTDLSTSLKLLPRQRELEMPSSMMPSKKSTGR